MNRFTYPTPVLPRETALKDKPASPRDDQGVNIALGPVLKKPVKFGKSGAIETHLRGSSYCPFVVQGRTHGGVPSQIFRTGTAESQPVHDVPVISYFRLWH